MDKHDVRNNGDMQMNVEEITLDVDVVRNHVPRFTSHHFPPE
jgi:hypothetical protein